MYADVIIDISSESVDRTFEYAVPAKLLSEVKIGARVFVPFGKGNRVISGFVINLKEKSTYDAGKIKQIAEIDNSSKSVTKDLIELAWFIKRNYGSTMNQALKCVLPVKKTAAPVTEKYICTERPKAEIDAAILKYENDGRSKAKLRLLKEISKESVLPLQIVRTKLNISPSTIKALEDEGLIKKETVESLREVVNVKDQGEYNIVLNDMQQSVCDDIWQRFIRGDSRPSLVHGITGSGKTEIYINLIDRMISEGRQAIVLIPEIALTYQTLMRFYRKFPGRVSVIHSKLTSAQKHDQLEKARRGEVDIIIGPRSALFVPFERLGIIIIDEEHENTYFNEQVPKYHAREVAIKRAALSGAMVVLGSATPSVDSYFKAQCKKFQLYEIQERAAGASLAKTEIVDLRKELSEGNRSIISRRLYELIDDRLSKKEQIILFINRRGFSSFVSCRSCGEAIKCPHCDVSLKSHRYFERGVEHEKLVCHYCGYESAMPKACPSCGSKYIGKFGTGTQKLEDEIHRLFPGAKTLRMDFDTTRAKDAHENILSEFSEGASDILIGTQMIVKGHDFANVTLVGIVAADLSLHSGSYVASERTFQLITQAAGRAGRGKKEGIALIQTYDPENYAIKLAAKQDYENFFKTEMSFRKALAYPPTARMLEILISHFNERKVNEFTAKFSSLIDEEIKVILRLATNNSFVQKLGPSDAAIYKLNDRYRKIIYIKANEYKSLIQIKDALEAELEKTVDKTLQVTFDFSAM